MSELPVERFQCAPGMRLQAHERVTAIHLQNLDKRLDRIEQMMERLERRLWLAVCGWRPWCWPRWNRPLV